ncbi:MAG: ABC transporter substrate-binding protein [Chloroflexi bacterium]|nr:ABC transporter substrate-binding protein [Chloroflexota bacterium]
MKRITGIVVVVLVLALVAFGCSSTQKTTSKTQAPTSSTSTAPASTKASSTAKPTSQAPTSSATSTAHAPVSVSLLSTRSGSGAYALAYALADIVNKNHPWMKITVTDTFGGQDNLKQMVSKSPKERETTIFLQDDGAYFDALAGNPPFNAKLPTKAINHVYYPQTDTFAGVDKNIKTYKDMIGKKVALAQVGHGLAIVGEDILKSWGIIDQVKIVRMNLPDMAQALMSGSVDLALVQIVTGGENGDKWVLSSDFVQVTKPLYYISWTQEFAEKQPAVTGGHNRPSITIPAGTLANQPEPLGVMSVMLNYGAFPELNPEIAYEIAKITTEKAALFGDYHMLGRSVKHIPNVLKTGKPLGRDAFSPGALKYFDEKGIVIPK